MKIYHTKYQIQEAINYWSQRLGKILAENDEQWIATRNIDAINAIVSKIMQEIAFALAFNTIDDMHTAKKIILPMRRSSNIKAYAIPMQHSATEHDLFVELNIKPNTLPQNKQQKEIWKRIFDSIKDNVEYTSIQGNESMARLLPGKYSFDTVSWKISFDVINDGCYAYMI